MRWASTRSVSCSLKGLQLPSSSPRPTRPGLWGFHNPTWRAEPCYRNQDPATTNKGVKPDPSPIRAGWPFTAATPCETTWGRFGRATAFINRHTRVQLPPVPFALHTQVNMTAPMLSSADFCRDRESERTHGAAISLKDGRASKSRESGNDWLAVRQ